MAKMQTQILVNRDRCILTLELAEFIKLREDEYVIVSLNTFYDTVDEMWKAAVHYWK